MQISATKKTLLVSLLLLCSSSAWAEWTRIAKSDEGAFYIDRATLRKAGNLRKVWWITDLKEPDADGAMSRLIRSEYDCKEERSKYLAVSKHSKPMAGGKVIDSYGEDPEGWREIPPESASEIILNMICAQ